MFRRALVTFGIYISFAASITGWVYYDAFETALSNDRQAGQVRLSEASSRLRGQLDVYRALVNIAAKDPKMARALASVGNTDVSFELTLLKLTYGAWEVDLADNEGRIVASSSPEHLGSVHSKEVVRAALNGRLGYSVEVDKDQRLVRYSRRVLSNNSTSLGLVVVSANMAALEFEWPITPEPMIFFDSSGLSMSANRPSLLLLSNSDESEKARFPLRGKNSFTNARLMTYRSNEGVESEVQSLTVSIPNLQMNGQILLSTKNARAIALLRLGLAVALLVALALIGTIFVQQRRRLALESRHSATLEQRVEERTAELQSAQNELMEASNLAALGRLSAGISHELNQPLAAILNYAENGKRLIQKSRKSEVFENLSQIADQIHRITRIISNLRAFAKQEATPSECIDLVGVVKRAMDLMQAEIATASVSASVTVPDHPLIVTAGKLRLEQVVLNLVSNSLDAMHTSDVKSLTVNLEECGENIILKVQDSGGGIKEPERVFEPFYTTKELGASKGLGMGLALSFGLVSHFGGILSCRNHLQGAEFTMILPKEGEAK
ncbi:MAG: ATP-binding protein [Sneathiella sp.]